MFHGNPTEAVPSMHLITCCISHMLQRSQVLSYIRQATDAARSPNPVMPGMDFLINLYSLRLYLSSSASLYLSLSQMYSTAREGSSTV